MNSQVALMKCQDKKQLAKRNSSRQAVFINTSQPEDRLKKNKRMKKNNSVESKSRKEDQKPEF